jgi:uncharacterized protein YbbK (DUF523 family)
MARVMSPIAVRISACLDDARSRYNKTVAQAQSDQTAVTITNSQEYKTG